MENCRTNPHHLSPSVAWFLQTKTVGDLHPKITQAVVEVIATFTPQQIFLQMIYAKNCLPTSSNEEINVHLFQLVLVW